MNKKILKIIKKCNGDQKAIDKAMCDEIDKITKVSDNRDCSGKARGNLPLIEEYERSITRKCKYHGYNPDDIVCYDIYGCPVRARNYYDPR